MAAGSIRHSTAHISCYVITALRLCVLPCALTAPWQPVVAPLLLLLLPA